VAVETVPPLFAAGVRFVIAGLVLLGGQRLRSARGPAGREWRNMAVLAFLMFAVAYGALFWAEKSVPSGVAAVLVATVPLWTALLEMLVFEREPRRAMTFAAVAVGLAGVAILSFDGSGGRVSVVASAAVAASSIAWSLGTALTTRLALPQSHLLSAGGQMLIGGAMLLAGSALAREVPPLPAISLPAAGAIAYQVVAGSLIAFTAYQWLLTQVPGTMVTSYAYVNPVVALVIGHELGGEPIGARTVAGGALVLFSTVALLRRRPAVDADARL
jgi:drug/metabolite transporter (DMT)-like permease